MPRYKAEVVTTSGEASFATDGFEKDGIFETSRRHRFVHVRRFLPPEGYSAGDGTNIDIPTKLSLSALVLEGKYPDIYELDGEFWVRACPGDTDGQHVTLWRGETRKGKFVWYRITPPKKVNPKKKKSRGVTAQATKPSQATLAAIDKLIARGRR